MAFYGRHKLFAMFWTWKRGPIAVMTDIASASGSKATTSTGNFSLDLFPRNVPRSGLGTRQFERSDEGWLDVLAPDDWVFVFVDPQDGESPECVAMGFIDRVSYSANVGRDGSVTTSVSVSCSSWEKAMMTISAITDPWIAESILQVELLQIAIDGAIPDGEGRTPRPGDDIYNPKTTRLISRLVEVFLRVEEGALTVPQGGDKVDVLNPSLTPEQLELARNAAAWKIQMEQEEASASVVEDDLTKPVPRTTELPGAVSGNDVRPLMAQYLLPQSDVPLWYLLRMRFEDLDEWCSTNPQNVMNSLGSPVAQMIDQWSNQLMNIVMYDVRRVSNDGLGHLVGRFESDITGGYFPGAVADVIASARRISEPVGALFEDIAPHMIMMKRPLFAHELLALEGPTFDEKDLVNLTLGYSDADHYNLTIIENSFLRRNAARMTSELRGFDADPKSAFASIQRHGLRIYNDQVSSWPSWLGTTASYDPAQLAPWNKRVQLAGLDAVATLNGNVTIPKLVRGLFLGGKLIIRHKQFPKVLANHDRVYFVDGIDWQWDAVTGSFMHSVALTRGYRITAEALAAAAAGV